MVIKNKKTNTVGENFNSLAMQAGVVLMTAAATLGMIELPDHSNKVIVPNQPAFAMATNQSEQPNPLRREREESAPHHISYSETQRTPGRTGKF